MQSRHNQSSFELWNDRPRSNISCIISENEMVPSSRSRRKGSISNIFLGSAPLKSDGTFAGPMMPRSRPQSNQVTA
jgi:hypothetical protein